MRIALTRHGVCALAGRGKTLCRILSSTRSFKASGADKYAIRRPRSPKAGVQRHKNGPLMEQGEGQMGNVGKNG